MKKVISSENIPIKLWLDDIETGAMEQAKNLANLPFAFRHIAIMPDSHQGYGMPIGGVLATKNVIIPNAVGVDIGCGMCAVKTSLTEMPMELLKKIFGGSKEYHGGIRSYIPVGFNHHKKKQDPTLMPKSIMYIDNATIICKEYDSALKQLGTLGGGNHFIEIQKDEEGWVWIMIHSGSRNIGKKTADYYNKVAKQLNKKWHSSVPEKQDLAFLPLNSKEGKDYIKEMNYCVEFALANRKLMMERVQEAFEKIMGNMGFHDMINIAHNYAKMENHFGENVMVHRKGATSARKGEVGIIPGSQGTASYIVEGLGNPESFQSCSHGAGRKMGRNQARKNLDLEEEKKKLEDQGIVHSIREVNDLDEASGAYKSIEEVMANQEDLVKILVKLIPLGVVKG